MLSHNGHRTTLNTIQMKKTLFAVFLLLSTYLSFAQAPLLVHSNTKGLYVVHTVAPKENFYSIGRLYSISPKEIVAFNGVDMAKGLSIGQKLMIPLMASNFSQTTQKGLPVVYMVGEGEGLMKVSQKNNNVLLTNLRQWNNLSSDAVSKGQSLVVGYINATGQIPAVVEKNETPKQETVAVKQEPKQEAPAQIVEKKPEPVVEKKQEPVAEKKVPETKTVPTNVSNQQMAVGGPRRQDPFHQHEHRTAGDEDAEQPGQPVSSVAGGPVRESVRFGGLRGSWHGGAATKVSSGAAFEEGPGDHDALDLARSFVDL